MEPMTEEAARSMLGASKLGVLSLADGGRAYAIPLFYGFDGEAVWFHAHPGRKDAYEDATEEACFTVFHKESENVWESVHAFGPVKRCSLNTDIEAAKSALFNVPPPPAPGNYPHGLPKRDDHGIYYLKLTPDRIEGVQSAFRQ